MSKTRKETPGEMTEEAFKPSKVRLVYTSENMIHNSVDLQREDANACKHRNANWTDVAVISSLESSKRKWYLQYRVHDERKACIRKFSP